MDRPSILDKNNKLLYQIDSLSDLFDALKERSGNYIRCKILSIGTEFQVIRSTKEIGFSYKDQYGRCHLKAFNPDSCKQLRQLQIKMERHLHLITAIERGLLYYYK